MLENKKSASQVTKQLGVVEQVFLELKSLQKDARRQTVVEIIGQLGSIGRRKEQTNESILHELARQKIEVTELAVDVALREYRAYPDVINFDKQTPVMLAAASGNEVYIMSMKRYNLRADRPLSQMDPNRPYTVNFNRKNSENISVEGIAYEHSNVRLGRMIRRSPITKI